VPREPGGHDGLDHVQVKLARYFGVGGAPGCDGGDVYGGV
jgi:hypothetical protein